MVMMMLMVMIWTSETKLCLFLSGNVFVHIHSTQRYIFVVHLHRTNKYR